MHGKEILTAIVILINGRRDLALVGNGKLLSGEAVARRSEAVVVHGMLERIILPAKNVITVLSEAGAVLMLVPSDQST